MEVGLDIHNCFQNVINNGMGTWFWLDWWLGPVPLYSRFPKLFLIEKRKDCVVADKLFMVDGWVCGRWDWTRDPTVGEEVEEFRELLQLCLEVKINSRKDKIVWKVGDMEEFSVKSIKEWISANTYTASEVDFVWNRLVPKKVSFVAWRAALARLPTFDALEKRNIPVVSKFCPFCGDFEESVEHIFVSCGLVQALWSMLTQWCRVSDLFLFSFHDVLNAHKFLGVSKVKAMVFQAVCLAATWCIWKKRNDLVHNGSSVSLPGLAEEVKVVSYLWIKNRGKKRDLTWEDWL
ncbi:uncharacterized protein LOC143617114 [Bidens hawaiensis]|uniref:uncharacterized protein LOC143617114 n=1 Tax=Bidens hawaiensis TaxID=980011 RepID=UPI0040498F3D